MQQKKTKKTRETSEQSGQEAKAAKSDTFNISAYFGPADLVISIAFHIFLPNMWKTIRMFVQIEIFQQFNTDWE